jgi:16S rRNA processing protein RimM
LSPHGTRGELKCRLITDFPKERFKRGNTVQIRGASHVVRSARIQGQVVLLWLEGVTDRTAAESFRGADVEVTHEQTHTLPAGLFYWHQVIGLSVTDVASGEELGKVADIIETGANDVYLVRGALGEVLIPAIKDVVQQIDPEQGRMLVTLLPGMLPTPKRSREQTARLPHAGSHPQAD